MADHIFKAMGFLKKHLPKFILFLFFLPSLTMADFSCPSFDTNPNLLYLNIEKVPKDFCGVVQVFYNLMSILKQIGGVFFLIMIVVAGLRFATAGSSPERNKSAKASLTAALMGLVIVLLSTSILAIIQKIVTSGSVD
jgi:hypothetical protein